MKPEHLSKEYGDQFQDTSIVDRYRTRPPYQTEVVEILLSKLSSKMPRVLDIGCGTGELSIPLANSGCRVDGLDPSPGMIALARNSQPDINWITCYAEDFAFDNQYDLIVAANSLHWTDWNVLFPKISKALTDNGLLAIVTGGDLMGLPVQPEIGELVGRYSTNQLFKPYSLVDMLVEGGYFECTERVETSASEFSQSLDDYIASCHARNGLSIERMGEQRAEEFDQALRTVLSGGAINGRIMGNVQAKVAFGKSLK